MASNSPFRTRREKMAMGRSSTRWSRRPEGQLTCGNPVALDLAVVQERILQQSLMGDAAAAGLFSCRLLIHEQDFAAHACQRLGGKGARRASSDDGGHTSEPTGHHGTWRVMSTSCLSEPGGEKPRTRVTYDRRTIPPLLKAWAERDRRHGDVIFVDEKMISPADTAGFVRALSHLATQTAMWDWTDLKGEKLSRELVRVMLPWPSCWTRTNGGSSAWAASKKADRSIHSG